MQTGAIKQYSITINQFLLRLKKILIVHPVMCLTPCKLKSAWGTISAETVKEQSTAPSTTTSKVIATEEQVQSGWWWRVWMKICGWSSDHNPLYSGDWDYLFPPSQHTHTYTHTHTNPGAGMGSNTWSFGKTLYIFIATKSAFSPARAEFNQPCERWTHDSRQEKLHNLYKKWVVIISCLSHCVVRYLIKQAHFAASYLYA